MFIARALLAFGFTLGFFSGVLVSAAVVLLL